VITTADDALGPGKKKNDKAGTAREDHRGRADPLGTQMKKGSARKNFREGKIYP